MSTTTRLRATAHPLRLRILSLLTAADLSASEVARELGTTQANASYHLRVLATAGLLEDAGQERIRGGVAKRYRHPWRVRGGPVSAAGSPTDLPERRTLVQAMAEEVVRRSAELTGGRNVFTDAELWVAPDVWNECLDLVERAGGLLHDAARPPRTPETVRVAMSAALFALTGPAAPAAEGQP